MIQNFKMPSTLRNAFYGASALTLIGLSPVSLAEDAPAPIKGVESQATGSVEVAADCQPFTMTDQDRELSERVMESLRADDKLRGRIAVSVLNGQVLLSGTVDSVPMIYRAVEVSRRVSGSNRVNADRLERG